MRRMRYLIGLLTVAVLALAILPGQRAAAQTGEFTLETGWNFVGGGLESDPAAAAAAAGYVDIILDWDADTQSYETFRVGVPASLNTLTEIDADDAIWVHTTLGGGAWSSPEEWAPRPFEVTAAWNNILWTGPLSPASAVLEFFGGSSLYVWDASSQGYLTFRAAGPSILNTIEFVETGAAIWVMADAAATVQIPSTDASPLGDPGPDPDPAPEPQELTLTSEAFVDGGTIPTVNTCDGDQTQPGLAISGVPADTASLALIVDDPDAPGGTFTHWVAFNIDPATTSIGEGVISIGTGGTNSAGMTEWLAPCPPAGDPHRYMFMLFALDAELDLMAGATADELRTAMEGRILAETTLTGLYAS